MFPEAVVVVREGDADVEVLVGVDGGVREGVAVISGVGELEDVGVLVDNGDGVGIGVGDEAMTW